MATLRDIAKMANVSTAAVSLYLNGKGTGRISEEKQKKIQEAIESLDYHPPTSREILKQIKNHRLTKTVAVYWASDIRASLLGKVLAGIQECILKEGLQNLNLIIRPYRINELYQEKELLLPDYYDGVIISNTSATDMQYLDTIRPPMPVVLLNRYATGYHTVTLDNRRMGRKIAEMMKKNGYQKAAVFRTQNPYLGVNERLIGFLEGCRELDISIPNEAQFFVENSVDGGMEAGRQFLNLSERPKTIFADNDWLALGGIHTLLKCGIRIPEEVSIIAIGQYSISADHCFVPSLTSLDVPLYNLAYQCIHVLGRILREHPEAPIHLTIEPELHIRESFPVKKEEVTAS